MTAIGLTSGELLAIGLISRAFIRLAGWPELTPQCIGMPTRGTMAKAGTSSARMGTSSGPLRPRRISRLTVSSLHPR